MTTPPILSRFPLSPEQRDAALARGRDVVVTAGAGTGKTRTLVSRFLSLLHDGLPLRSVVAVTFTRKAAREMRNRVRAEVADYLAQLPDDASAATWQDIYNDLDAARINTIHNICAEILRTHPAEAGIDPRFDILDETATPLLVQDVSEAALGWAAGRPEMAPLFELLDEAPLLELIRTLIGQRTAVARFIVAVPPETIRDHWAKQITELQAEGLEQLPANPEWRAAEAVLRENQPLDRSDKAAEKAALALATLDSLPGESVAGKIRNLAALKEVNKRGGVARNWPGGEEQLAEVKEATVKLKELWTKDAALWSAELNPLDDALAAATPAIYALFAYATNLYDQRKAERAALDFDDLETGAIALLEGFPDVRAFWQGQVRALLVDEFQDTNEDQLRLVRLLCPDPGKLFIVGDAKQSIYRFRGADVQVFSRERGAIATQEGLLLELDVSYRAHAELLEGMNRLLRPIMGETNGGRPWVAPFAPLRPGRDHQGEDLPSPAIVLQLGIGRKKDSLPVVAARLATEVRALRARGVLDYGDVAILCRSSGSFPAYEDALDEAGIPYVTVAGKGFYQRPEIRDLLNALAAIEDPHDDLALVGLLRSVACGLSDETLYHLVAARPAGTSLWAGLNSGDDHPPLDPAEAARLRTAVKLIGELNAQAGRTPVAAVLKQLLDRTHYRAILRRAGETRALRNVNKLLLDVAMSELVSVGRWLEHARTLRDSGSREGEARAAGGGAVQIMTIHAAKGLEFPVVVLGDAARDGGRSGSPPPLISPRFGVLLPIKEDKVGPACYELTKAQNAEQEDAENKRLLYVALTRAEQLLLISGTLTESNTGKLEARGWLKELDDVIGFRAHWPPPESAGQPTTEHTAQSAVAGTPVGVTFCWDAPPTGPTALGEDAPAAPPLPADLPLLLPVPHRADKEPSGPGRRVWQVAYDSGRAPGWLVGTVVHEALALWRFPDGPAFDAWAVARAREHGLTSDAQLDDCTRRAAAMLARFQAQPLFREMDTADRRLHELPFSYAHDGLPPNGIIDALYERDGRWTVVDFKTDDLRHKTPKQVLDGSDYEQQVQRYGLATAALLGTKPRLLIYFLDAPAGMGEHPVTPLA